MSLEISKGEMILFYAIRLISRNAVLPCLDYPVLCTPTGIVNIHFQGRPIYAVPRCTLRLNNVSLLHDVREFRNFYFPHLPEAHAFLSIWADIWVTRFSVSLQLFTNYPWICYYNRKYFPSSHITLLDLLLEPVTYP